MMKGWSVVYKTPIHSRAEIVKGVLTEWEIDAVLINKKDSSIHMPLDQVEVLVPSDQVLIALKIIRDYIKFE